MKLFFAIGFTEKKGDALIRPGSNIRHEYLESLAFKGQHQTKCTCVESTGQVMCPFNETGSLQMRHVTARTGYIHLNKGWSVHYEEPKATAKRRDQYSRRQEDADVIRELALLTR